MVYKADIRTQVWQEDKTTPLSFQLVVILENAVNFHQKCAT
jgi:hypothetical protein